MKSVILKAPIFVVLSTLFTSCAVTYGDYVSSSYTKIATDSCSCKAKNVQLYFENEKLNFEYEKIGLVEAVGSEKATNETILDYLKYDAWNNCANAIINVNTQYKDRESGTLFTEEDNRKYSAKVFSGLAVKIKPETTQQKTDTLFVTRVKETKAKVAKQKNNQVTASVIWGVLGTSAIVLVLANQ